MSSTADIVILINALLEQNWTDDEKTLLKKLSDNLLYYKKLIPASLKQDLVAVLRMANAFKSEHHLYKSKLENLKKLLLQEPIELQQIIDFIRNDQDLAPNSK